MLKWGGQTDFAFPLQAEYSDSRETSEHDPYSQAATTGDVLANEVESTQSSAPQPRFNVYK